MGVGQTWQNVTASRSLSTVYTNSTGKPIAAAITGSVGNYSSGFIAYVDGIEIFRNVVNDTVSGSTSGGMFVIPSGSTYFVVANGAYGGGTVISRWMELR